MFYRAVIEAIDPDFDDPRFGSFRKVDKGGCSGFVADKSVKGGKRGEEENGDQGGGCLREYFNHEHGIRVTFSFKTYSRQNTKAMEWLISPSQRPDLFLTATGAWDLTYRKSLKHATLQEADEEADSAIRWIQGIASDNPKALVLGMTLNSCHNDFLKLAERWNERFNGAHVDASPQIAVLDRQVLTAPLRGNEKNKSLCEGWHAYNEVVIQHVQAALRSLCLPRTK
jgi:hypothetical protein